jgi:hypothetical protein
MSKSPRTSSRKNSNKPSLAEKRAIKRHAQLIGLVTYHWNELHATLEMLFGLLASDWSFFDPKGRPHVFEGFGRKDMWNALKSDDSQRAILKALAGSKLWKDPEMLSRINWLIDEAGYLSTYRNDATHVRFSLAPTANGHFRLEPGYWQLEQNSRIKRLTAVGHERLFSLLISDLEKLSAYGACLWSDIYGPERRDKPAWSLQKKPRLRARELVEKSPPKTNSRQQRPKGRKRQPLSSRA